MTIDVAARLTEAADLIEMEGWWSGFNKSGSGDGKFCATTAICNLDRYDVDALNALSKYLDGPDLGVIWEWNDAPGQTKENVIATMRACAAIWRAKHEERQSEAEMPRESVSA